MKKQGKDRLLEVMSRLDSTFKPKLNENFNDSENEERLLNLRKMILLKQEELRAEINKLTTLNLPENIKWDLQKLQMELDTVSEKLHYSNSEMSIDEIYKWILDLERDISNYIAYVNDLGQEDDSEYMNLQRPKMNSVNEYSGLEENTLNEDSSKSPINKYVMFSYNYQPNFIGEIWSDDPNMAKHLQSKFSDYYDRVGSDAVMNKFYVNLDGENQRKLEDWIINNYRG